MLKRLSLDRNTGQPLCIVEEAKDSYKLKTWLTDGYIASEMQHRSNKSDEEQKKRTKDSGEVFTCNYLVNGAVSIFTNIFFGRKNVFTTINKDFTYIQTVGKVKMTNGLSWQDFIFQSVIEPTCGEVPHLVTKYDVHDHTQICPITDRCGVLDNKLRVLNENVNDKQEWTYYAKKILEVTYAFDLQGDNVYWARLNIFLSLIDYYKEKFGIDAELSYEAKLQFVEILSYNIFQMDIFTQCVPYDKNTVCEIVDWRSRRCIPFSQIKSLA